MAEESVFDQESQYLERKDRVALFETQVNDMENILQSFKAAKVSTPSGVEAFFARLQQSRLHQEREFSELVYDLAEIYKDLPEFNSFFKKWIQGQPETDTEKTKKFYALVRTSKTDLIKMLSLSMQIFAKTLNNYAVNSDILWHGVVKMYGQIKSPAFVTVKPEQVILRAGEKRAREVLIDGKDMGFIAERDGVSRAQVRAEKNRYKSKFEKEGLIAVKNPSEMEK